MKIPQSYGNKETRVFLVHTLSGNKNKIIKTVTLIEWHSHGLFFCQFKINGKNLLDIPRIVEKKFQVEMVNFRYKLKFNFK